MVFPKNNFDRVISITPPDLRGREAILRVHLKDQMVESDINLRDIAHECQGFSGAHLASLVNGSAMHAARDGREKISYDDMLAALEFERLGPVQTTPPQPEIEKRIALLEAATALTAYLLPHIEDVLSVTIIPREKLRLGKTILKFDENHTNHLQCTCNYLENLLIVELAGRAAENLFYKKNELSYICQERLTRARQIATTLVITGVMVDSSLLNCLNSIISLSKIYSHHIQKIRKYVLDELMYEGHFKQQTKISKGLRKATVLLIRNHSMLVKLTKQLYVRKKLSLDELQLILRMKTNNFELMKKKEMRTIIIESISFDDFA
jgi:cell division protease FtsH